MRVPGDDLRRARGRPPGASGAETRQQIIAAARRYFIEFGYSKTSYQTIAASEDLTRAAIYNYFGDKQSLYRAAITAPAEALVTSGQKLARSHVATGDRLSAFLLHIMSENANRGRPAHLLSTALVEAYRNSEMRSSGVATVSRLRTLFETESDVANDGDRASSTDTTVEVEMLLTLAIGLVLYAYFAETDGEVREAIETIRVLLNPSDRGRAES